MLIRLLAIHLFVLPLLAAAETTCFEVSDESLKLARKLSVVNEQLAFSATPVVDRSRPYGGLRKEDDIRQILMNPALSENEINRLHRDALRTFQIMLRFGELEPGSYRVVAGEAVSVTENEIKMQQHFNFIDEIDAGKTGVNPKRPYGDFECWELDVAEALGEAVLGDEETACEQSISTEQRERFHALHGKMFGFVRALLAHGKLTWRRYKADMQMIGIWERCG